jgi:16S rRNA (adenine1518-N6/adenine1519-N6)-dimethyltransferase
MGNPPIHRARKRFGQHFLHDQNIIRKLVNAINPQAGQNILEIGPGQGALTFPLLQRCKKMTAIELDRDLIAILQKNARPYGELLLINQDILQFDLFSLTGEQAFRVVGNLPYNISTPLMFHLLKQSDRIQDMHFMVQKEVAERIIAEPNTKHYGRLSVMMQFHCQCDFLFKVAPGSFTPPPKVDSAIIRLIPHAKAPVQIDDISMLELVVKTAFNQRRKTISNSLKKLIDKATLTSLNINPAVRAENLTLSEYAQITQTMTNK